MKFFQLKTTLGLALGESWPLLAQPQKNTDVHKGCFRGKAFLSKPAEITFGENKDGNASLKFRRLYNNSFAPALGGACAMGTNTMALIQTF